MRVPSNEVRKQICDTLNKFYCETPDKQDVQCKFSRYTQQDFKIHSTRLKVHLTRFFGGPRGRAVKSAVS